MCILIKKVLQAADWYISKPEEEEVGYFKGDTSILQVPRMKADTTNALQSCPISDNYICLRAGSILATSKASTVNLCMLDCKFYRRHGGAIYRPTECGFGAATIGMMRRWNYAESILRSHHVWSTLQLTCSESDYGE